MAQAGGDIVVLSSPEKMAMIKPTKHDMSLDEIAQQLGDEVDLIISEGCKRCDKPMIDVSRAEVSKELLCTEEDLVALATDQPFPQAVPQFPLDDAGILVDLLEKELLSR